MDQFNDHVDHDGRPGGGPSFDPTQLLPILTGATSFIGGIFAYVILPIWVFYILKDRVMLVSQFDRGLPVPWRFDTWAVLKIVRRVFGQWVRARLVLGVSVGLFTFVGLLVLSRFVDPVFGRYAVLLSVIAGILELVPIIGPIISAVPAVLLAATAGLEAVVAAFALYLLVQQTENNLLVPKIQGDAIQLHPALVMFAIVIGGALAGLLGAILALPVAAALRDVTRYLFRRLSPESNEALAEIDRRARTGGPSRHPWAAGPVTGPPMDPYKVLQVDPEAEDEVIHAAYRRLARKYHPDVNAGPDGSARMASINAAWELLGDPLRRAAFDRQAPSRPPWSGGTRRARRGRRRGGGPGPWGAADRLDAARPEAARDGVARLDERAVVDGGRLRRIDADARTGRAPPVRRRAIRPGPS